MVGTMAKIDDSVKKKVPELRFAGFADDWEQRKLGELASNFEYGLNASAKEFDGIHKYIRITDIDDSSRKFNSDSITSPDIDLSSADNYKLKNGDLLFARTGASVGKSYLYTESDGLVYYAGFLIRARLKSEFDSNFVFQNTLTSDYNNFIKVTSQRSGQPGVNAQEYASFNIKTPCYDEQQKIGLFFKQLDDLITLHQRKLDLLKEQKKGYLQKMFPKNGEKVPELRFAGFTDDWEERKLGDVVGEIQSGNRLPKDSLTNGDVPYVVAQTKNDGVFKKIARGTLDYNGNPMKLFPGNSISFSIDNPEAMFYRNAEFYTSNIMRVIHEDHLTHEQYVFILENMKRFIRGYDWSRKFSGPVVSNLEYLQPSEEEQQKIGSFFKQLDDTIALHQRKLDLLKEQKKGFLQKMFV